MPVRFHLLLSSLILASCLNESAESIDDVPVSIPDHLSHLENLTVYPPNLQPPDTVLLIRETVFESNEDVQIAGSIRNIAIDDSGRVFIAAASSGAAGIYVFNHDGSYLTMFGRYGQGPGDFESIGSMEIWNNRIYVFDSRLQRFSTFSLENYELVDLTVINKDRLGESDQLAQALRANHLFITQIGTLLLRLSMFAWHKNEDINKIAYYELSRDGYIQPGVLLELERFQIYFPDDNEGFEPLLMPYLRSSLVAISGEGNFISAWTDDFLVKQHDKNGNYMQAFYYPYNNSELHIDQLELSDYRRRVLRNYEQPGTWPALHAMEIDDEDRLWIATITDDPSSFLWWVVDKQGELIAQFKFPGARSSRSALAEPLIKIKNGYLYTRERDIHQGTDQIIKYKIRFKSN